MIPGGGGQETVFFGIPRESGDDPQGPEYLHRGPAYSPRERG